MILNFKMILHWQRYEDLCHHIDSKVSSNKNNTFSPNWELRTVSILSFTLFIRNISLFCHYVKSLQIRSFFMVRIFPHSDWTRYLSVFSPNAGKYGPEKTPYLGIFNAVCTHQLNVWMSIFLFKFLS